MGYTTWKFSNLGNRFLLDFYAWTVSVWKPIRFWSLEWNGKTWFQIGPFEFMYHPQPLEMTKEKLVRKLIALAQDWDKRAWKQVPTEYSSRNLHYKFLKLDNEAAGLVTCAEELKALIDSIRAEEDERMKKIGAKQAQVAYYQNSAEHSVNPTKTSSREK